MTALNSLASVDPFTRLTEVLAEGVQVYQQFDDLVAVKEGPQPSKHTYAQYLDEKDIQSIQECIRGVVSQSVIPWMEARIREWNEVYSRSRKGVTAKLFGAGRRLFGSGSLGSTVTPNVLTGEMSVTASFNQGIL